MGMQNFVINRAFHGVHNLSPNFVYATKGIQCFKDLWNEEENKNHQSSKENHTCEPWIMIQQFVKL